MGCVWGKFAGLYGLLFRSREEKAITRTTVDGRSKITACDINRKGEMNFTGDEGPENDTEKLLHEQIDVKKDEEILKTNRKKRGFSSKNCTNFDEYIIEDSKCKLNECDFSKTQKLDIEDSERTHVIDVKRNGIEQEDGDNFEDILSKCPSNVVIKILGYLEFKDLVHSVSLVSKTWHNMAFEPALWCNLDIRNYTINDLVMKKLPQLCSFIRYIFLPDVKNDDLTDDGLVSLAVNCPNLTTFIAPRSGSKFSDVAFVAFAEHCPHLRKFSLDGLDITDRTLTSIAWHLSELEDLSLSQVSTITNEGVAEVIKRCRNLQILVVNQNKQITEKCLESIPQSSCSLRRLHMLMCNIHHTGVHVIGQLKNLEQLNLSQCVGLTAEHLLPVLQGCRNLQLLSLNLDKKVDDRCLDVIFTHLPNLEQIYLVSTIITDEGLNIMGQKGKKLVRIDIGYTKVTAVGARIVSELCTDLRYLGLMRCDDIRESEVEKLVEEYPHIMYSTFIQDTKRLLRKADLEMEDLL